MSNNIIEQINTFSYVGCSILYQNEKNITVKNIDISPDNWNC